MSTSMPAIGFIGLGSMGGPMARNLLKAGYQLTVFDVVTEKTAAFATLGATPASSLDQLVQRSDLILTSVPSFEVAVKVSSDLLPYASPGKVFVELSTLTPQQTIQLANAFAARGALRLDVPVSGGAAGAEKGSLRMFVGGDQAAAERIWPVLEILGDPDHIVYCGPAGHGQMVKIVNQLAMGLSNAIYLETIGFATRAGIDTDILVRGIGGDEPWRAQFTRIAQRIRDNHATHTDVKFVQLKQFVEEANLQGYEMPLARALFEFCDPGERISVEEIYPAPSFWHELMKKRESRDYL